MGDRASLKCNIIKFMGSFYHFKGENILLVIAKYCLVSSRYLDSMFIYDTSIGYFNFYNHEVVVKHKQGILKGEVSLYC